MTGGNAFADAERFIYTVDETTTPVVVRDQCRINDALGKVGGVSNGDARLFETDNNTMVFKLPQDTIKTIRDSSNAIKTGYTKKRFFGNETIKVEPPVFCNFLLSTIYFPFLCLEIYIVYI